MSSTQQWPLVLRGPSLWMSQFAFCGAEVLCMVWCDLCFRQAATNLKDRQGWKTTNSAVLPKGRRKKCTPLGEHHKKCMDTQHLPEQCFWVRVVVACGFFFSSQQQCWSWCLTASAVTSEMLWEVRSAAAAFPTFSSSHHPWAVCSWEDGHPLMQPLQAAPWRAVVGKPIPVWDGVTRDSSLRRDGSKSPCFCFWEQCASRGLCRGWHCLVCR